MQSRRQSLVRRGTHVFFTLAVALGLGAAPVQAALQENGSIAFSSNGIYTINPDGSGLKRLTDGSAAGTLGPAFSPDSKKVAFFSPRTNAFDIYTVNTGDLGVNRVTYNPFSSSDPDFSPDGSKIVFAGARPSQDVGRIEFGIWIMNADGSGEARLTTDFATTAAHPTFSPDGRKIAFDAERDGKTEIYIMNPDGTGLAQLTNDDKRDRNPAFSPDGTRIAFEMWPGGSPEPNPSGDIYTMNVDGSGVTRLTTNFAIDREPVFSPDGTKVAFTSDRAGGSSNSSDIYTMNADGSGVIRLTDLGSASSPDWGTGGPAPVRPADTNSDGVVRVAVLGDSYIAGVGGVDPGEPYDPGTDTFGNRCRRTSYSWGPRIAARLGANGDNLLFAACNGAKSPDVISRAQEMRSPAGVHGGKPQVTTLRDWNNSIAPGKTQSTPADIVLLSIGGNDVDFAGLARSCLMGRCLWFVNENRARDERYQLAETFRTVLATAKESNPKVELWVANYPNPVSGTACTDVGYLPEPLLRAYGSGVDGAEQVFIRDRFLATLNESVAWAADAVGAQVLDLSSMASGHELCSSAPYFNGVSPGLQGDSPYVVSSRTFHPNKAGYAHFDEEIWNRYSLKFGQASRSPLGGSGAIPLLAGSIRLGPDPVSLQDTAPADVLFEPGNQVHLRVVDAPPGNYRLVVRSLPTVLADVDIPTSGDRDITFTVPEWFAPDAHWLTIEDRNGIPILSATLQVGTLPGCAMANGDSDVDGDRLTDHCDAVSNDGPKADADRDGIVNADDNCSLVANPTQADVDADGLGDACDPSQGGDPTSGYLASTPTRPGGGPPPTGGQQPPSSGGQQPPVGDGLTPPRGSTMPCSGLAGSALSGCQRNQRIKAELAACQRKSGRARKDCIRQVNDRAACDTLTGQKKKDCAAYAKQRASCDRLKGAKQRDCARRAAALKRCYRLPGKTRSACIKTANRIGRAKR